MLPVQQGNMGAADEMLTHKCHICGKSFATPLNGKNYMCPECKQRLAESYAKWVAGGRKQSKRCIVCGGEIIGKSKIVCSRICVDRITQTIRNYRQDNGLYHKRVYKTKAKNCPRQRQEKRKPGSMDRLNSIIHDAAELGMTYGEYVAQQRRLRE